MYPSVKPVTWVLAVRTDVDQREDSWDSEKAGDLQCGIAAPNAQMAASKRIFSQGFFLLSIMYLCY